MSQESNRFVAHEQAPAPPHFDLAQTLSMTASDPVFARELIDLYLSRLTHRLDALAAAFRKGDREVVTRTAHSLSSSSRVLGVQRVGAIARHIEEAASSGDLTRAFADVPLLIGAVNAFRDHIAAFDWSHQG